MASQRLTNEIRETAARAVLRHRFTGEIEALVRDRAAFAEEVYCDIYRKPEREKIEALPDGWLPTSHIVTAKFGESNSGYAQLDFDGSFNGPLLGFRAEAPKGRRSVTRRVLHKHQGGCWKVYDPTHRLSKRFDELQARRITLEQIVKESEKQIEAALGGVTTVTALLKAWPEMEPFIKPLLNVVHKLPAIPVVRLNEMFKLPVAKAA